MAQIRLEMGMEPDRVFEGTLIAEESTETGPTDDAPDTPLSLRWAEFKLYRHDDGRYILYVVGRTVVYHVLGNACGPNGARRGKPLEASVVGRLENLGPYARACPVCRPPMLLAMRQRTLDSGAPTPLVDCETNRFAYTTHDSAQQVVDELRFPEHVLEERRRRGQSAQSFSGPAERLMEAARLADPAFAALFRAVQPL